MIPRPGLGRRTILWAVGFALAAGVGAVYGVGWALSRPVQIAIGAAPQRLAAESVEFTSGSGSTVHGWWSRRREGGGVVLLLPGVRANRTSMIDRALMLRDAGYSVLLIDFQATGESPGDAITFGWLERLDVLAAVDFIRQHAPGQPIGIVGQSLGGAATLLAAPELDVQAAVLEAVYPSIGAAVENRLRIRLGGLAVPLSPLLLVQLKPRLGIWPSELRPVDRIAQLRCPILIVGGTADRHTTPEDTQRLYEAARPPKELWMIPGAAHVDFLRLAGEEYRRRVLDFLDRRLRSPGHRPAAHLR